MEDFRENLKRKDTGLAQDVATRWNSTYRMCRSALTIRSERDEYCSVPSRPEFLELRLDEEKWEAVTKLVNLLELYQQATLDVSVVDSPTLHFAQETLIYLKDELDKVETSGEVSDSNYSK